MRGGAARGSIWYREFDSPVIGAPEDVALTPMPVAAMEGM
uniref:Uncharacterized protein n=1 Tax=Arundo donax TaxID=35708 RepID=A0A0A9EJC4_ARUDO